MNIIKGYTIKTIAVFILAVVFSSCQTTKNTQIITNFTYKSYGATLTSYLCYYYFKGENQEICDIYNNSITTSESIYDKYEEKPPGYIDLETNNSIGTISDHFSIETKKKDFSEWISSEQLIKFTPENALRFKKILEVLKTKIDITKENIKNRTKKNTRLEILLSFGMVAKIIIVEKRVNEYFDTIVLEDLTSDYNLILAALRQENIFIFGYEPIKN